MIILVVGISRLPELPTLDVDFITRKETAMVGREGGTTGPFFLQSGDYTPELLAGDCPWPDRGPQRKGVIRIPELFGKPCLEMLLAEVPSITRRCARRWPTGFT